MFSEHVKKVFSLGQQSYTLETGILARQAGGAVLLSVDETVVLATVVGNPNVKPGQDFFPLTVDYVEKFYAAGRIPGGFFKREGRPSEKEVLTSRLIDRPLRPLFPDGFFNEVQVTITVLSLNPEVDADIPAMVAASAALAISGIPFDGPIGGVRIGYANGKYLLNPATSELPNSQLNLVVAGTRQGVLMVESEAQELSEEVMLGAVTFGHNHIQTIIDAISEFAHTATRNTWEWQPAARNQALVDKIRQLAEESLAQAYSLTGKQARTKRVDEIYQEVLDKVALEETPPDTQDVRNLLFEMEGHIVRGRILAGKLRIDGRDTRTVRPLAIRHGLLPRAHGSALFVRGETQALVIATLGTNRDEQIIDALPGEYRERFMLHYNMPPFATGETGRLGSPKRREVGHGRLAKRALVAILPKTEDFQYTIRLVSEVLESNGSSSMASVCGGSLALMDAGVPIRSHVAGIAMGLIKEGEKYAVLTDILGDEDHLGDMDFKVAGTDQGITALQMDIKIQSITPQIMEIALKQAKEGRLHILQYMNQAIPVHRQEISAYAPRLITIKINPEKIRDVIGKGGAVIRALSEESGAVIDVTDDGTITIASVSQEGAALARKRIEDITAEVEVGRIYEGTVLRLLDFGAIISILPGRDGLLHISQIANERVNNVSDFLKEGQAVRVKVLESDEKGRVRLSMKAV